MNLYKCLKKQVFVHSEYTVQPLRFEDIHLIKEWRNEQMDILRQKQPLTTDDQINYYNNVISKLFQQDMPRQLLFSFFYKGVFIGYGGLVHMSWLDRRGEVSFLVNTERAENPGIYRNDFLNFLELIKKVAFEELDFNRIFTETFNIRKHHISILESSGFRLEGIMKEHVFIKGVAVDALLHGFLKKQYHA